MNPALGYVRGTPPDCHVAAGPRATVLRTLRAGESFEVLHRVGEAGDRWLNVRLADGLVGYIPDNGEVQVSAEPEPPPSSAAVAAAARTPGVRDMTVGAGLCAIGVVGMLAISRIGGPGPATGLGKEWGAIAFGVFMFLKGLMAWFEG
jgi:hypothetical protein